MEELLLTYGPLGVMCVGLATTVVYMWRGHLKDVEAAKEQMEESRKREELLRDRLEEITREWLKAEADMNAKYNDTILQQVRAIERLTR